MFTELYMYYIIIVKRYLFTQESKPLPCADNSPNCYRHYSKADVISALDRMLAAKQTG